MRRIVVSLARLIGITLALPLLVLLLVNGRRWYQGEGFEPAADNLILYAVLLFPFSAAALTNGLLQFWKGFGHPKTRDIARYALAGAVGATFLTTAFDLSEFYFTPKGVGIALPLMGIVTGALFGALHRATAHPASISSRKL